MLDGGDDRPRRTPQASGGAIGVIGAGVMGAGIAAQVANAGVPVVLLDIVPRPGDRSAMARRVERLLKTDPAPFMHKAAARLVTPGNIEDDLALLADATGSSRRSSSGSDVKRELYAKLQAVRKPGSIVSSNTSTIPLPTLIEGMQRGLRRRLPHHPFLQPAALHAPAGGGAPAPATRAEAVAAISRLRRLRARQGASSPARTRPGFIANRIGGDLDAGAINRGLRPRPDGGGGGCGRSGRPIGVPKTGVFGLLDLVGIDLMPHVARQHEAPRCREDDAYVLGLRDNAADHPHDRRGPHRPQGQGRLLPREKRPGGGSLKRRSTSTTGDYRAEREAAAREPAPLRDLRALVEHPDRGGRYAWRVLLDTLGYAAALVPEIADDVADVDAAMRLGYNWKYGPFELIDRLGAGLAGAGAGGGWPPGAAAAGAGGRAAASIACRTATLEYFGTDGGYPRGAAAGGRAAAGRREAPVEAAGARTAAPRSGISATASPASNSTAR